MKKRVKKSGIKVFSTQKETHGKEEKEGKNEVREKRIGGEGVKGQRGDGMTNWVRLANQSLLFFF